MFSYQNKIYKITQKKEYKVGKMTKRDMAYHLNVDVATLYNWRKHKPNLYRIVMLGFKFDELIEQSKKTCNELCEYENLINQDIEKFSK